MKTKKITIDSAELKIGLGGYLLYKGKPVIDVAELPGGRSEMYFCDKNKKPLPDSPMIICGPEHRE